LQEALKGGKKQVKNLAEKVSYTQKKTVGLKNRIVNTPCQL